MKTHLNLAESRRTERAKRARAGLCIVCGLFPSRENRRSCSDCGRLMASRQQRHRELRDCPPKQPEAVRCNPEAWYMTFDAQCPTAKSLYRGSELSND
jgi:hypothetical protein